MITFDLAPGESQERIDRGAEEPFRLLGFHLAMRADDVPLEARAQARAAVLKALAPGDVLVKPSVVVDAYRPELAKEGMVWAAGPVARIGDAIVIESIVIGPVLAVGRRGWVPLWQLLFCTTRGPLVPAHVEVQVRARNIGAERFAFKLHAVAEPERGVFVLRPWLLNNEPKEKK